jgi:hypothetical protein
VTQNVIDQKDSNLCVPISVATLLRFAIKNDLDFEDEFGDYSAEAILANLTLIIFPRSMAGLNLNPNEEETEFQSFNQVKLLLNRVCKKTYLMPTGWEIIRKLGHSKPKKSTCKFEMCKLFIIFRNQSKSFFIQKIIIHENLKFCPYFIF